jgi:hypothetical protein
VGASFLVRLVGGVFLAIWWTVMVAEPLAHASRHDLPEAARTVLLGVALLAPVALYVRRHTLDAAIRWDREALTLLRGGRVVSSIAWSSARVRLSAPSRWLGRGRVLQITDDAGRRITLTDTDDVAVAAWLEGKRRVSVRTLDALLRAAAERGRAPQGEPEREVAWLPLFAIGLAFFVAPPLLVSQHALAGSASAVAIAVALLVAPVRHLVRTLRRPSGSEILLLDTEERGRLRARRLVDGTRVLLDVTPARHPDALLATRRGFVNAVLAIPSFGTGTTYRAAEEPIPATYVETRDDRVLRFEALRAALVDLVGYGAFLATALLAVMLTA